MNFSRHDCKNVCIFRRGRKLYTFTGSRYLEGTRIVHSGYKLRTHILTRIIMTVVIIIIGFCCSVKSHARWAEYGTRGEPPPPPPSPPDTDRAELSGVVLRCLWSAGLNGPDDDIPELCDIWVRPQKRNGTLTIFVLSAPLKLRGRILLCFHSTAECIE